MMDALNAVAEGRHGDAFALLGPHRDGERRVVRTIQPHAAQVDLLDDNDIVVTALERVHPVGVFAGRLPPRLTHYRLRVTDGNGQVAVIEDPYRFGSTLGDLDLHLLGEGSHRNIGRVLGSRVVEMDDVSGTRFAVWAPNASRVSVVGSFNDWDGRRHPMRCHPGNGLWEIFVPGVGPGAYYKFELLDKEGRLLPLKSDPLANYFEPPPGNASVVYRSNYE